MIKIKASIGQMQPVSTNTNPVQYEVVLNAIGTQGECEQLLKHIYNMFPHSGRKYSFGAIPESERKTGKGE